MGLVRALLRVGLAMATAVLVTSCASQPTVTPTTTPTATRHMTWHLIWADSSCDGAIAIAYGASGDEVGRTTPEQVDPIDGQCSVEYEFIHVREEAPFRVVVGPHTWTITDSEAWTGPTVW